MAYTLHVPGALPRHLRWTVHDPRSSYGNGVLVFRNSRELLDAATFRALRDRAGAWIATDRPDRARSALGLFADESLGAPGTSWEVDARPMSECLKAWTQAHQWRRQDAAAELRVSITTFNGWCDGRPTLAREPMIRRMMDLIDALAAEQRDGAS